MQIIPPNIVPSNPVVKDEEEIECIFIKYEPEEGTTAPQQMVLEGVLDMNDETPLTHDNTWVDDAVNSLPQSQPKTAEIPAGKYVAKITNCRIQEDTENDYDFPVVEMDLEIKDGAYAGATLHKRYHLKTENACKYLYGEFKNLGITVGSPSQLAGACNQVIGMVVEASVKYLENGNRAIYVKTPKPAGAKAVSLDELWNFKK